MSRERLAFLLLLGALAGAMQAGGADWTDLSPDCLAALPQAEGNSVSLGAACPALTAALRDDPWSGLLVQPVEDVPAWALMELTAMAAHYRAPAPGPRIALGRLDAILASLPETADETPPSLWERFQHWLAEWLGDEDPALPPWLEKLSLPEGAVTWLWGISTMLIVLLAVAVVANEIRHYGGRRRGIRETPGRTVAGPEPGVAVGGVPGSPVAELEALFRMLVARLQAMAVLPARPSLTHREVAAAAGLPDQQRRTVDTVSRAAERAVYGDWQPDAVEVAPVLDDGRQLLAHLSGQSS